MGSLAVSVTGFSYLSFRSTTSLDPVALTSFGSLCLGEDFDNTMKLGQDWFDVNGSCPPDAVTETTWGKIKQAYLK